MQKLHITFDKLNPNIISINDEPILYTKDNDDYILLTDIRDYLEIDKFFIMNKDKYIELYCDKNKDSSLDYIFRHMPLFSKLTIVFNYISYHYNILSIIFKRTFSMISDFNIIFYVDILNRHERKYYYVGTLPEFDNTHIPSYFLYYDDVIYKELYHKSKFDYHHRNTENSFVTSRLISEFYIYECSFYYDETLPNSRTHSLSISKKTVDSESTSISNANPSPISLLNSRSSTLYEKYIDEEACEANMPKSVATLLFEDTDTTSDLEKSLLYSNRFIRDRKEQLKKRLSMQTFSNETEL